VLFFSEVIYVILFLEGVMTFISPCLLPLLPVYIAYFTGGSEEKGVKKTIRNAVDFVLGFTTIFAMPLPPSSENGKSAPS